MMLPNIPNTESHCVTNIVLYRTLFKFSLVLIYYWIEAHPISPTTLYIHSPFSITQIHWYKAALDHWARLLIRLLYRSFMNQGVFLESAHNSPIYLLQRPLVAKCWLVHYSQWSRRMKQNINNWQQSKCQLLYN